MHARSKPRGTGLGVGVLRRSIMGLSDMGRWLAGLLAILALTTLGGPLASAQTQRIVIVQDGSASGASLASDQAAYRMTIALDDALRDAGFDVPSVTTFFQASLSPRAPQPERPLSSALIVASVEQPVHLLVTTVFLAFEPAAEARGQEQAEVRLATKLLSYRGSLLAETPLEPIVARAIIPRGCRDDCVSSKLSDVLRDPLRQLAEAVRGAVRSR